MMQWAAPALDTLWHNGLAAIPLVLVAAAASRLLPCLPATRHLIWVTVLIWLVGSSLLPQSPVSKLASLNSTVIENTAKPIAAEPTPAAKTTKPRILTARLAKTGASARTDRRVVSKQNTLASEAQLLRTDSTPPPRYAARAETSAPDKLARAQEAAGPRSLSNLHSAWPPSFTTESAKRNPSSFTTQPKSHVAELSTANKTEPAPPLPLLPKFELEETVPPAPAVTASSEKLAGEIQSYPMKTPLDPPLPRRDDVTGSRELKFAAPLKEWAGALVGVRNAVSQLPPIPQNIWLGGTGLLLMLAGARIAQFHRRLRRARPAPREVQVVVESACRTLSLRRVPVILMVDGRMSPMVWCGVTPKLVLPTQLWEQLDDVGRQAVVFHELAHIRRRDHRTAWIESAIGMLYWWHPLVWWVRGRLHAEAENCCDAWVMTLLPKRRAYATALLKTREYLSGGDALPAMGIGITPGRARLFARRLTMVMTESVRPKLSASGITLVMLVALCGWVAAPARSCPEEDAKARAAKDAKAPCAAAKVEAGTPCAKEGTPSPKAMTTSEKAKTSYEKHMAEREKAGMLVAQPIPATPAIGGTVVAVPAQGAPVAVELVQVSDKDGKKAKRVAELQAELARLERKIETLEEALGEQDQAEDDDNDAHEHAHGHADDDGDDDDDTPRAPRAPRPPKPPHAPHAPNVAQPFMPPVPPMPPMPPIPPSPGAHGQGPGHTPAPFPRPGQSWADVSGEKTAWRTYKLPKEKAEAFFKFMSRSDVPIWVRSNPEGIDIQATAEQHGVFNAFFQLVDPSGERGAPGAMFFGQAGPLMAFAHGHGAGFGQGFGQGCGKCMEAAQMRAFADEMRASARAQAVELRTKARGDSERIKAQAREEAEKARARIRQHARDARSEVRDEHETIEQLERQAQALAEVAQNYNEQAERINERVKSVNERVEKDAEAAAAADAYRMHVESLERSAEELNRHAEELQRQSESIEQRAREVEDNAREMEEHADELDQRAEAVREAVDTLETGVQPTPELVESVLALVSGIEQMIPDTKDIVEDAISAASDEPDEADEPAGVEPADEIEVTPPGDEAPEAPVIIESEPKDGE